MHLATAASRSSRLLYCYLFFNFQWKYFIGEIRQIVIIRRIIIIIYFQLFIFWFFPFLCCRLWCVAQFKTHIAEQFVRISGPTTVEWALHFVAPPNRFTLEVTEREWTIEKRISRKERHARNFVFCRSISSSSITTMLPDRGNRIFHILFRILFFGDVLFVSVRTMLGTMQWRFIQVIIIRLQNGLTHCQSKGSLHFGDIILLTVNQLQIHMNLNITCRCS